MIYSEYDKLQALYDKYQSVEVAGNLIRIATNQRNTTQIEELLSKHAKNEEPTQSMVDLICWAIVYYSQLQKTEEKQKKHEKLIQLMEKLKEEVEEKEYQYFYHFKLVIEGYMELFVRNLEKAIAIAWEAIEYFESKEVYEPFMLGTLYNTLGIAYLYSGTKKAKPMFLIAREHFSNEKIARGVAIANGNLADIYIAEGRYNEAMTLLYEFDETMRKLQEIRNLILNYSDIYYCLKSMGRMEEAEQALRTALELMKEYDEPNEDVYIDAVEFYALKGETDKAEEFLEKYQDFYKIKEVEESLRKATWLVYKGFIELKKMNIQLAEKHLREGIILGRNKNTVPIILQGLMYLIELLITKLKIETVETKRKRIIEEIELLGQECIGILKNYRNIYQMINYSILLSTAYVLSNDFDTALDTLSRAEKICKQYELDHQLKKVHEMLRKIDLFRKEGTTQYELTRLLHQYSTQAVQGLTYLSEPLDKDRPIAILVILPSGLPCFSYKFEDARLTDDDLLISGLISAIQKFSSEISWKKGTFRLMAHSDYILLLEPFGEYTIAVFLESFSEKLREKLNRFSQELDTVIKEFGVEHAQYLEGEQLNQLETRLRPIVEKIFS